MNFSRLIEHRAERTPDGAAYTFLADGEGREQGVTWSSLEHRVRAVGGLLQQAGASNQRVLLLFAPGLDYVAGFLACLYAGAVAVPAYPPDPARLGRTLPRLETMVADAQASVVLTTAAIHGVKDSLAQLAPGLGALRWLTVEQATDDLAAAFTMGSPGDDTLAMLQYTSGSTGSPRAVMLTHGNLHHNSEAISRCFQTHEGSRLVSWLPPYHDMGLIGCILQPLYRGFFAVLMSPLHFLARPLRWLEAISRHRATISGGPNFAYDLCVRKLAHDQRAELDLGCWHTAFNGAEPIRGDTLAQFSARFARFGFSANAFLPCYGLAEATLLVAGARAATAQRGRLFDADALEQGQARGSTSASVRPRNLVGCGPSIDAHELRIVDPDTRCALAAGRIGELWLRGPSIARGYWGRPDETAATFGGRLDERGASDASAGWLRTGDLGFVEDRQLYVTGRLKDLLIVRGRNHYPQDLEQTALSCHAALRAGCAAVFTAAAAGSAAERLVLVHEVDPRSGADLGALSHAIIARVADEHGVRLDEVVLIAPHTIPKTSSGKIQRTTCQAMWRSGQLEVLARGPAPTASAAADASAAAPAAPVALDRHTLAALPAHQREACVRAWLRARVAAAVERPLTAADGELPLVGLGLDSLRSVELRADLESALGISLPGHALLDDMTLERLVQHGLAAAAAPAWPAASPVTPHAAGELDHPLSFAQEEIWVAMQLRPAAQASYLIPAAVELRGSLHSEWLAAALDTIARRHHSLRTCFPATPGAPRQRILPHAPIVLAIEHAPPGTDDERAQWAHDEARREGGTPLDLRTGPVFRARLLRLAADHHVFLFTTHHIVADGWSMAIFIDELGRLYRSYACGDAPALPAVPYQYVDFARWQRTHVSGERRASLVGYWQRQLAGLPDEPPLPGARTDPGPDDGAGRTLRVALPAATAARLAAACARANVTPFVWGLACFHALLAGASRTPGMRAGVAVLGREVAGAERLIGNFVNMLVLPGQLGGDPPFLAFVDQTRQAVADALAHQDLPHALVVRALAREHARHAPLFRAAFGVQNQPHRSLVLPGLEATPLQLDHGVARLDLTLWISKLGATTECVWTYATRLFDGDAIARLHAQLVHLLEVTIDQPEARLSALPLHPGDYRPDGTRRALDQLAARRATARSSSEEVPR